MSAKLPDELLRRVLLELEDNDHEPFLLMPERMLLKKRVTLRGIPAPATYNHRRAGWAGRE